MARTFTDAFAAVDEARLDRAAGFTKERPPAAPPMEVHPAWSGFHREFDRLVRMLVYGDGTPEDLAEEALGESLLELLDREPERFQEDPEDVLGFVFSMASKRVLRLKSQWGDVRSLDQLLDMKHKPGDEEQERLDLARPLVAYTKAGVDEDARFTPPPAPGEPWERHHCIGAVQRFRDEFGRAPMQREFDERDDLPPWWRARKLGFATVNDLLLEAGVPIERATRRRKPWSPVEAAEECYRFRRREGYWPSETDALRLPLGTLPGTNAMFRLFGGTTSEKVQEGCEMILGPIDRPTEKTSGELTARLRRAMGFEGGGLSQPALS